MKYVVVDMKNGDIFTTECSSAEEATKEATFQWNQLSDYDKKKRESFEVIESDNPDEEAENHLDGNVILKLK